METSREKLIRLLLTYPKRKWMQRELATLANCSRPFVSKLVREFAAKGILANPYKNQTILIDFFKLLNIWATHRKMPPSVYVKLRMTARKIENFLKSRDDYALTLFSAAWYRTHFMQSRRWDIYTANEGFISKAGDLSKSPTDFVVYVCERDVFEGCEMVAGLKVVSAVQTYADLMSFGGIGTRVAQELAENEGWL